MTFHKQIADYLQGEVIAIKCTGSFICQNRRRQTGNHTFLSNQNTHIIFMKPADIVLVKYSFPKSPQKPQ